MVLDQFLAGLTLRARLQSAMIMHSILRRLDPFKEGVYRDHKNGAAFIELFRQYTVFVMHLSRKYRF